MELYISELFPEEEMKEVIAEYGCGLEMIEFSIAESLDHFFETVKKQKMLVERLADGKNGPPKISIHGPFLDLNPCAFDSRIRQVTYDRFAQAYEAAQIFGADTLVLHSGMVPSVYYLIGWAERVAEFFNRFMEGRSGVRVLMENVLDKKAQPFLEVAEAVEHPDFGICLDLGHAHCYSEEGAACWAELLAGHIRHVHLHNNFGEKDEHRALCDGSLCTEEILPRMILQNPGLTGTVECADRGAAEASLSYVRKLCGGH